MSDTKSDPGLPTAPTESPSEVATTERQHNILQQRPEPSQFETVQLGIKTYNVPVGETDNLFRQQIFDMFAKGTLDYEELLKKLHKEELAVLRDMGFLKETFLLGNAMHIPAFFKALPDCTSDASVMLKKQCEPSYFLIYALLFHASQEASTTMQSHTALSDLQLLENAEIVSLAKKRPGEGDPVREFVLKLLKYKKDGLAKGAISHLLSEYGKMRTKTRASALNLDDIFVLYT